MMKTLKLAIHKYLIKIKTELQEIEVYYHSLEKTYLQTHVWKRQDKVKKILLPY